MDAWYFEAAFEDSLPLEEQIPMLIGLTSCSNPQVALRAANSLAHLDGDAVANWLKDHGTKVGFTYFARRRSDSVVIAAILDHRHAPGSLLEELAPKLEPDLQEVLMLRQDAIVKRPKILAALESNPALTAYCKKKIWEYREHLLLRDARPVNSEPVDSEPVTPEPQPAQAGPRLGMFNWRELTLMSCDLRYRPGVRRSAERMLLEQLPHLQAAVRAAVARQAGARVLAELLYDASPAVVRVALGNPRLQEPALLQLLAGDRASPAVLEVVASHVRWRMRYSVRLALCRNPKTPFEAVAGFVRTLQPRDLMALVAKNSTASMKLRKLAARHRRKGS